MSVRGSWSGWRRVLNGIPQESVLGSVLISVFIDDQEEGLMSVVLKFADETEIFRWVNSEDDQRDVCRRIWIDWWEWSEIWQMKLNVGRDSAR